MCSFLRQLRRLNRSVSPADNEAVIHEIDFQVCQSDDLIEALRHHGFYHTSQIWCVVQADGNLLWKFIQQPQEHGAGVGGPSGSSRHVQQNVHLEVCSVMRSCIAASFMDAGHLGVATTTTIFFTESSGSRGHISRNSHWILGFYQA